MPKSKTHKGVSKRFKVTGSGKIRRRQTGRGHLQLAKGKRRYRRLSGEVGLARGDEKRVRRLLKR